MDGWAKLRCGSTYCANRRYNTAASNSGRLADGSSARCWSESFPAIPSPTWRWIRTGHRHCLDTTAASACATSWSRPSCPERSELRAASRVPGDATTGDTCAPELPSRARLSIDRAAGELSDCGLEDDLARHYGHVWSLLREMDQVELEVPRCAGRRRFGVLVGGVWVS